MPEFGLPKLTKAQEVESVAEIKKQRMLELAEGVKTAEANLFNTQKQLLQATIDVGNAQPRLGSEILQDTSINVLKSGLSIGETAASTANFLTFGELETATGILENFKRTKEIMDYGKSESLRASEKRVTDNLDKKGKQRDFDLANIEGGADYLDYTKDFLGRVLEAGEEVLRNPAALGSFAVESSLSSVVPAGAANFVRERAAKSIAELAKSGKLYSSIPTNVTGEARKLAERTIRTEAKKAVDKKASFAALAAIGVLEGSSNAAEVSNKVKELREPTAENIDSLITNSPVYNDMIKSGLSHEEAVDELAENAFLNTYLMSGVAAGIASKVTGTDKLLGNLLDKQGLAKVLTDTIKGVVNEAPEELIQSGVGQLSQNVALKNTVNEDQDLSEDVATQAGIGAAVGAVSGGVTAGTVSGLNTAISESKKAIGRVAVDTAAAKEVSEALKTQDFASLSKTTNDKGAVASRLFDENVLKEVYKEGVPAEKVAEHITSTFTLAEGAIQDALADAKKEGASASEKIAATRKIEEMQKLKTAAVAVANSFNEDPEKDVLSLIKESKAAVQINSDNLYTIFGSDPSDVNDQVIANLGKSIISSGLSQEEKDDAKVVYNTRKDINDLNKMSQGSDIASVAEVVVNGGEIDGVNWRGANTYFRIARESAASGNTTDYNKAVEDLTKFVENRKTKADLITKAFNAFNSNPNGEAFKQAKAELDSFTVTKSGEPLTINEKSSKLVNVVNQEAKVVESILKEVNLIKDKVTFEKQIATKLFTNVPEVTTVEESTIGDQPVEQAEPVEVTPTQNTETVEPTVVPTSEEVTLEDRLAEQEEIVQPQQTTTTQSNATSNTDNSLQRRMTSEIGKIINPSARKYLPKEQVKTKIATQFIGEGAPNSSTENYKNMYAKEGVANTGNYSSNDTIYVSSNGARKNRVSPVENGELQGVYKNIDKAIAAGSTIVMDTREHLVKTQKYNLGEIALARYLANAGYIRQGNTGIWKPNVAAPFKLDADIQALLDKAGMEVKKHSALNSRGEFNPLGTLATRDDKTYISINSAADLDVFYDYILGNRGTTSEQKGVVLKEIAKQGVTLDDIKSVINTKERVIEFLILHELNHLANGDRDVYFKNGKDPLTDDKIAIETRATIEPFRYLENKYGKVSKSNDFSDIDLDTLEDSILSKVATEGLKPKSKPQTVAKLDNLPDVPFTTGLTGNRPPENILGKDGLKVKASENKFIVPARNTVIARDRKDSLFGDNYDRGSVIAELLTKRKEASTKIEETLEEVDESEKIEDIEVNVTEDFVAVNDLLNVANQFVRILNDPEVLQVTNKYVSDNNIKKLHPHFAFIHSTKDKGRHYAPQLIDAMAISLADFFYSEKIIVKELDAKQVNKILGRPEETVVTQEEFNLVAQIGDNRNNAANTLGKQILKTLGVKVNPKLSTLQNDKMESALGNLALSAMAKVKLIEVTNVTAEDLRKMNSTYEYSDDFTLPFYKVNTNVADVNGLTLEDIYSPFETDPNVLNKAFGVKSIVTFPSTTKPTKVSKTNNRGDNLNKATQEKVLKAAQNTFTFPEYGKKFMRLSNDTQAKLSGIELDESKIPANKLKSVLEGKNPAKFREIENFKQMFRMTKDGTVPFYLIPEAWSQGRFGYIDKAFDPQNSKIHRAHSAMEAHIDNTVDPKNARQLDLFKATILDRIGTKINKISMQSLHSAFTSLVQNQVTKDAIAAYVAIGEQATPEQEASILKFQEEYGIDTESLEILDALFTYSEDAPFKTSIRADADGTTNGLILGYGMYATYAENFWDIMEAGGFSRNGNIDYTDIATTPGFKDLYEMMADSMIEHAKNYKEVAAPAFTNVTPSGKVALTPRAEYLVNMLGQKKGLRPEMYKSISDAMSLLEDNYKEIASILPMNRSMAKPSTTTIGFGASIKTAIKAQSIQQEDTLYEKLIETSEDPTKQAEIKNYIARVNSILGTSFEYGKAKMLDPDQEMEFRERVSAAYTPLLEAASASVLGAFMHTRDVMNKMVGVLGRGYIMAYYDRYFTMWMSKLRQSGTAAEKTAASYILKSFDSKPASIEQWIDRINDLKVALVRASGKQDTSISTLLNKKETKQIEEYLEKKGISAGLKLKSFGKDTTYKFYKESTNSQIADLKNLFKDNLNVQVSPNGTIPLFKLNENGERVETTSETMTGKPAFKVLEPIGVGFPIITVHNTDGLISISTLAHSPSTNQHDSNGHGMATALEAITNTNKIALEALLNNESDYVTKLQKHYEEAINNPKFRPYLEMGETLDTFKQLEGMSLDTVNNFGKNVSNALLENRGRLKELKSSHNYFLPHTAYQIKEDNNSTPPDTTDKSESEVVDGLTDTGLNDLKAAIDKSFGSAPKSGLQENFTEASRTEVDGRTAEQLFDSVVNSDPRVTNARHIAYLKDLLNKTITKVMSPVKVAIDNTSFFTRGEYHASNDPEIKLVIGQAHIANSSLLSAGEAYVHELVHHISAAAIDGQGDVRALRQLRRLYAAAERHITVEDFYPSTNPTQLEKIEAQKLYDYIFRNLSQRQEQKELSTQRIKVNAQRNNFLHEFFAFGLTNELMRKALAKPEIQQAFLQSTFERKNKSKFKTINKIESALEWLANKFLEFLNRLELRALKIKNLRGDDVLFTLAQKLTEVEVRQVSKLSKIGNVLDNVNSKAMSALSTYVRAPLSRAFPEGNVAGFRVPIVSPALNIALNSQGTTLEATSRAFDIWSSRMGMTKNGLVKSIAREMLGKTKSTSKFHALLRYTNNYVDKERNIATTSATKFIQNAFSYALTSNDKRAAYYTLLKGDASSLLNDNSDNFSEVIDLLLDSTKRKAEIESLNNELASLTTDPNALNYYKAQIQSLAYFNVEGKSLLDGGRTLLNAHNIARASNNPYVNVSNVEEITPIIDKLITLRTLELNTENINVLKQVHTNDMSIGKDLAQSGVITTLLMQKLHKDKSLRDLFDNDPTDMIKGYTKESVDPYMSFAVAKTEEERIELENQNYVFSHEVYVDSALGEVSYSFMVNEMGGLRRHQSGVFSLTDLRSKGHELNRGDSNVIARTADALNQAHDYTLNFERSNSTTAIGASRENPQYRYTMSEESKEKIMHLNTHFDEVMGSMFGSLIDKNHTQVVNSQAVALLKEDYETNFRIEPDQFTLLTKDSDEYRMLPESTRKLLDRDMRIQQRGGLYVREGLIPLIFGQRKISIGNLTKNSLQESQHTLIKATGQMLAALGSNPKALKAEAIWQDIMSLIKDWIVVKSGFVLSGNILSNFIVNSVEGMGLGTQWKYSKEGYLAILDYKKLRNEMNKLEFELTNGQLSNAQIKEKKARIVRIQEEIAKNPVKDLVDEGVFQSIIEEVDMNEDTFTRLSQLDKLIDPVASRTPEMVKEVLRHLFITHDTPMYKFLRDSTQLSDFVSRYALYKHNQSKGMNYKDNIDYVMETFIDYDLPTHPYLQYANDMGFLLFTKFFLRIQKVILRQVSEKTVNLLASLWAQNLIGFDAPDITDTLLGADTALSRATLLPVAHLDTLLQVPAMELSAVPR